MIGLSLPLNYLAAGPDATPATTAWQGAFGAPEEALEAAREAGVTWVELRSVGRDTHPDLALRAARRVWDSGLALTIHGHLPNPALGRAFAELYPALAPLAAALRARGCASVMTLHPYSGAGARIEELVGATVQALSQVMAAVQREAIPLRVALENERNRPWPSPTATYEGVVEIIERVESPQLGACWDLGHACANVQTGEQEPTPPREFLRRVIHTHIHDLGPRTHCSLTCGVVPLEPWLDLLYDAGYTGILNLELSPERFQDGPAREFIYASLRRVKEYLRRREAAP